MEGQLIEIPLVEGVYHTDNNIHRFAWSWKLVGVACERILPFRLELTVGDATFSYQRASFGFCLLGVGAHFFNYFTMEDDKQILKDVEDELKESNEALPPAKRNKRPARLYYGVTSFVMFLYLLLSAIALGSFGEIQREISGFYGVKNRCILFAHTEPISSSDPDNEPARVSIEFKSFAPCIFLFWGLVSGIILAFFMEVYAIVMIIIAPRM